jgi:hypothetical protein
MRSQSTTASVVAVPPMGSLSAIPKKVGVMVGLTRTPALGWPVWCQGDDNPAGPFSSGRTQERDGVSARRFFT